MSLRCGQLISASHTNALACNHYQRSSQKNSILSNNTLTQKKALQNTLCFSFSRYGLSRYVLVTIKYIPDPGYLANNADGCQCYPSCWLHCTTSATYRLMYSEGQVLAGSGRLFHQSPLNLKWATETSDLFWHIDWTSEWLTSVAAVRHAVLSDCQVKISTAEASHKKSAMIHHSGGVWMHQKRWRGRTKKNCLQWPVKRNHSG